MKYPYIGESQFTGSEVLLASRSNGFRLDVENAEYCNDWDETVFKNITREYLTNTYGKVESQEHADFIVELAKVNGFEVIEDYESGIMWFNCDRDTLDFYRDKNIANNDGEKQITIPMPPKCDDVKPILTAEITHDSIKAKDSEGNEVKPSYKSKSSVKDAEASIIITDTTPTVNDCVVDRDFHPTPLNNGDNLLFGGEDKCKEWPCVGEEVTFKHTKWNVAAKYNHMLMLVTHDDCGFALACKNDLQKPKTPEEELRDEILSVWSNNPCRDSIIDALISNYNITKKPQ